MSKLALLKATTDLAGVAKLLAMKAPSLSYVLYIQPPASKYHKFDISKRYGGVRTICAPIDLLKSVQHRLSELLQDCVEEIEVASGRSNTVSHGFRRQRTIITNATEHRGRRHVFNVDLKDFFPSINFGRVRGFFLKDKNFALHPNAATVIAQIACFENALPQGSPSSPVISNLIANILDMHLVALASQHGCRYTRYADDLTFSTNKPTFPNAIAVHAATKGNNWITGKKLDGLVRKAGFEINPSKTRMQYADSRQQVTGLVVNRKINVPSDYRRNVRAMTHHLVTKGIFHIVGSKFDSLGKKTTITTPGQLPQLHGMLAYIDRIDIHNKEQALRFLDPKFHDKEMKYENHKLIRKETTFCRFLLFSEFYAAPKPVLLCEGPSDRIYIRHAIVGLASRFPILATKNAAGDITLNIRRYKYEENNTNRILHIRGGCGPLLKFIATYKREAEKFTAPGLYQPVIILVDNDSGPEEIYKYINTVLKISAARSAPFVHIAANLYLVPTPLTAAGKSTKMEDFFDASVKSIVVNGKSFDPDKEHEDLKHYGKVVFAHQVIAPHASKIDFMQFAPLLSNIESLIKTHIAKHPKPP